MKKINLRRDLILLTMYPLTCLATEAPELSLSDLLDLTPAKIVSASKSEENLDVAPSVVTVYTEADIQRIGARSVADLLQRTVGFYNSNQYSNPMTGDRGIIADSNAPWLVLIDNRSMNSDLMQGAGSQTVFPLLNNVKRLEIVRGPGSTLWGTDAALGIIHIITKDGADLKGFSVDAELAMNSNAKEFEQHYGLLYGTGKQGDDLMVSLDWMGSAGYPDGPNQYAVNGQTIYAPPLLAINKSYQLYAKAHVATNSQFVFKNSDLMLSRQWSTYNGTYDNKQAVPAPSNGIGWFRVRMTDGAYTQLVNTSSKSSLEFKLWGGMQELSQQDQSPYNTSAYRGGTAYGMDHWSHEYYLGAEITYTQKILDNLESKIGTYYRRTEFTPSFSGDALTTTASTSKMQTQYTPSNMDNNVAAYAEVKYEAIPSLIGIAGLRLDNDSYIYPGTTVLPRFSVIYKPESSWSAKFLYNTGYVRPATNFSLLGQHPNDSTQTCQASNDCGTGPNTPDVGASIYGADRAEKIQSYDLQVSYYQKDTSLSLTGYQITLSDYFLYSGAYFNNNQSRNWIINSGNLTSRGIEGELRQRLTPSLNGNLNVAYVISSKFDGLDYTVQGQKFNLKGNSVTDNDGNLTGMPHFITNFGTDWAPFEHFTVNENVRMIANTRYQENGTKNYTTQGLNCFVDLAANYAIKDKYSLTLFIHNLLDNATGEPSIEAGLVPPKDRTLGLIAKYYF